MENTASACRDEVDNDGDGHTDCADQDCGELMFCAQAPSKTAQTEIATEDSSITCQDGSDNDGDGHVDCADQDCGDFVFCANKRTATKTGVSDAVREVVVKSIPNRYAMNTAAMPS